MPDTILMRLLRNLDVGGKRVFLRADLDVSVADIANSNIEIRNSKPVEPVRLVNLKPTVDYLLNHGVARILIAGHIGRPETLPVIKNPGVPFYVPNLSTQQLVEPLKKILGQEVIFAQDFGHVSDAKIELFENLRFWSGETGNDQVFANKLSILGEVYVNDAFGNCHREHASMVKLPALLPHGAGLHLQKEVEDLTRLMAGPARPFVAVIGGIKKETKLPVITNLAKLADNVLVGGALVKELSSMDQELSGLSNVTVGTLTPDGTDLDDATISSFKNIIGSAKTVVWNGPLGHFEEGHIKGSMAVVEAIAPGAFSVVGGGETTEMLGRLGILGRFSFVSSGGGAMLEFLAGKRLPGISALE